jgi:hypothetical protein
LTLDEIVATMRKRRIQGSRTAVSRSFARHDFTFKNNSLPRSNNGLTWSSGGPPHITATPPVRRSTDRSEVRWSIAPIVAV